MSDETILPLKTLHLYVQMKRISSLWFPYLNDWACIDLDVLRLCGHADSDCERLQESSDWTLCRENKRVLDRINQSDCMALRLFTNHGNQDDTGMGRDHPLRVICHHIASINNSLRQWLSCMALTDNMHAESSVSVHVLTQVWPFGPAQS